jgi:hypothetical protein
MDLINSFYSHIQHCAPFLSALTIANFYFSNIILICRKLYWCRLCAVLYLLEFEICLIFLAVKCQNVGCRDVPKCRMTFSVSIIRVLRKLSGVLSMAKLKPSFMVCMCSVVKEMLDRLITRFWNVCVGTVVVLVFCFWVCNVSSFLFEARCYPSLYEADYLCFVLYTATYHCNNCCSPDLLCTITGSGVVSCGKETWVREWSWVG